MLHWKYYAYILAAKGRVGQFVRLLIRVKMRRFDCIPARCKLTARKDCNLQRNIDWRLALGMNQQPVKNAKIPRAAKVCNLIEAAQQICNATVGDSSQLSTGHSHDTLPNLQKAICGRSRIWCLVPCRARAQRTVMAKWSSSFRPVKWPGG